MALAAENDEFSPEEIRSYIYTRVPIPGVQIVKSAELTGISDYKHTHLHLHLCHQVIK